MNRFSFQLYRIILYCYSWIDRHLTPVGSFILLCLLFTGAMGIDMGKSLAYQVLTLLLGLLLVSWLSSLKFRCRVQVERHLPAYGSVDSPLTYRLYVTNLENKVQTALALREQPPQSRTRLQDFRAALDLIRSGVTKSFYPYRRLFQFKEESLPPLIPGIRTQINTTFTPTRRGIISLSRLSLIQRDPLGLIKINRKIDTPGKLTILPRRYQVPDLNLPGHPRFQPGGMSLASSIGESGEFVSLRDYRRGDPIRHIHWKSWARTGKPIVKEFQNEYFVRYAMILDTFSDPEWPSVFEEAVSLAASFACALDTQESLLDLMFVGSRAYCFTIGRGLAHREQMLELLASVEACSKQSFQSLHAIVSSHTTLMSGCVTILLDWNDHRRKLVDLMEAQGIPTKIYLVVSESRRKMLEDSLPDNELSRLHFLEVGRIQEGLDS